MKQLLAHPIDRVAAPRTAALCVASLAVFVAISLAIQTVSMQVLDATALRWVGDQVTPGLAQVARGVGTQPYTAALVAFEIGLCVILARRRAWAKIGFVGASVLGSYVLNRGLKLLFARERPVSFDLLTHENGYSFPSGHAMACASIALVVILVFWHHRHGRLALLAGVIFMLLVGLSRLLIGAHFPTDVLAGWAAGFAWVAACHALILRRDRPHIPKSSTTIE